MFRNYLKTAIRQILRQKFYSFINVAGLSLGIAVSILIMTFVIRELDYDTFHRVHDRLYRVAHYFYRDGKPDFSSARTYPKVGPALQSDFPEVESYCRLMKTFRDGVVRYEDKSFKEDKLFYADSSFFTVFSYPLLEGNGATALREINTAVIEKETARKYFGDDSAIGKRVTFSSINGIQEFEITGVIESPPHSHLHFNFLFSYPSLISVYGDEAHNAWGWWDFYTYVVLKSGSSPEALEKKFPAFADKYGGDRLGSTRVGFALQPITDIHLNSHLTMEAFDNNDSRTMLFLTIAAMGILFIALINYINLSSARSLQRAREIGVRKVVGSGAWHFALQFMTEAFVLTLIATVLSICIVYFSIPLFNYLTGANFTEGLVLSPIFLVSIFSLMLAISLLAGIYPSLVLTSLKPYESLKGVMKQSVHGMMMRKGLVVLQFIVTVCLIAGTITVFRQLQYLQAQPIGADISETLVIKTPDVIVDQAEYNRSLENFQREMIKDARVSNVTISSEVPGKKVGWYSGAKRIGLDQEQARTILYLMTLDQKYFEMYDIQLIAGRNFNPDASIDSINVILNQKAIEVFGFRNAEEAISEKVLIHGDTFNIIGVTENYFHESPKEEFRPTAYLLTHEEKSYFSIKLNSADETVVSRAAQAYAAIYPGIPFDYFFLEDFYNGQYHNDRKLMLSYTAFACIAIAIACLGLFGLASFAISQRTKEVGIRKVLGASVNSIVFLFAKDFMILVIIANFIALPFIYIIMTTWLENFAARIDLKVDIFALSLAITVAIAALTVLFHAMRAGHVDPAKTLKQN